MINLIYFSPLYSWMSRSVFFVLIKSFRQIQLFCLLLILCALRIANRRFFTESFILRQLTLWNVGDIINPLNPELNPICYLLALLGAHHFLHVSRIRVKLLTFRLLMSYIYIYMEHPLLMFLDHTQRRSTVGRTPLDE